MPFNVSGLMHYIMQIYVVYSEYSSKYFPRKKIEQAGLVFNCLIFRNIISTVPITFSDASEFVGNFCLLIRVWMDRFSQKLAVFKLI